MVKTPNGVEVLTTQGAKQRAHKLPLEQGLGMGAHELSLKTESKIVHGPSGPSNPTTLKTESKDAKHLPAPESKIESKTAEPMLASVFRPYGPHGPTD